MTVATPCFVFLRSEAGGPSCLLPFEEMERSKKLQASFVPSSGCDVMVGHPTTSLPSIRDRHPFLSVRVIRGRNDSAQELGTGPTPHTRPHDRCALPTSTGCGGPENRSEPQVVMCRSRYFWRGSLVGECVCFLYWTMVQQHHGNLTWSAQSPGSPVLIPGVHSSFQLQK